MVQYLSTAAPFNTNDPDLSPFLDLTTSFYYLNNQLQESTKQTRNST